jgi:type 1 glutamine amidotransferase
MAATRIVIRKPWIIAMKAAVIATTSRMRNPLRKRSEWAGGITRHHRWWPGPRQIRAGAALLLFAACGASAPPTSPTGGAGGAPLAHLLVVTHTAGFRHSSIAEGESTIAELARQSGAFDVAYARTAADVQRLLTADALRGVDAVAFVNTTGNLGIPDMAAFLAWLREGRGFVGVHSASDTYHDDPRYLEMLGNEFDTHGEQAEVDIVVDDTAHPSTAGLGQRLRIRDEIYRFRTNNRGQVGMLLSLDRYPADGLARAGEPGDLPIAWQKAYGAGRVFYTALGHREDVWQDARFRQHLRGALLWALRR